MVLIQNFGLFIVSGVISMLNISLLQIVVIKFSWIIMRYFHSFEADPVSPPA
jgi:hypothetical protein